VAVSVIAAAWLMVPRDRGSDAAGISSASPALPTTPTTNPASASATALPSPALPAPPAAETAAAAAAPEAQAPRSDATPTAAKPRATDTARAAKKDKPSAKPALPAPAEPAPAAPPPEGQVRLAVSPWGNVEVDGRSVGTTPPLTRLSLPAGTHQIVVRNGDFPAYTASVTVSEDKPVTLRHRFE
jgi:serine/threonine-protein kinase